MNDATSVEIRVDSGTFAVESLEDICKANKKAGVLSRITVTWPAAPSRVARFDMVFREKP